jgi:thymidylate synthase
MMIEQGKDLNSIYNMVVSRVMIDPEHVSSPRGMETREVLNANIVLKNPRARLITDPIRKTNYGFGVGEFIWYWTGQRDLEFIERYNKRLRSFSDDGVTLNSAYGNRIFGQRRRDNCPMGQWRVAVEKLCADPDSRQAILKILAPSDLDHKTKDTPCTCTLQFFLRSDRLYLHVHMRSNDVFWGLPYDVFSFTILQEAMALQLSERLGRTIELGEYYHTAGSLHIYGRHFEDANAILGGPPVPSAPQPALGSLDSLWRTCEAEAYLSTRQPVPDLLRAPSDTLEGWMEETLTEYWRTRA